MDKSSCNKDTGTEMFAEEEDLWGNLHPLDLLSDNRETTSSDGSEEHDDLKSISEVTQSESSPTYKLLQRVEESRTRQHLLHYRTLASPL